MIICRHLLGAPLLRPHALEVKGGVRQSLRTDRRRQHLPLAWRPKSDDGLRISHEASLDAPSPQSQCERVSLPPDQCKSSNPHSLQSTFNSNYFSDSGRRSQNEDSLPSTTKTRQEESSSEVMLKMLIMITVMVMISYHVKGNGDERLMPTTWSLLAVIITMVILMMATNGWWWWSHDFISGFVSMSMALPLCPPHRIEEAFELMRQEVANMSPAVDAFAEKYLDCVRAT